MAESSYYHFNRFTVQLNKSPKDSISSGFSSLIEQYLYHVEFFMIPDAILNKNPVINLAKFPQNKRSEELIEKAEKLGLYVYRVYFTEKDYLSWENTSKGHEDGSYKGWVEYVFFKLLIDDQTYYPYKQDDGFFH